MPATRRAPGRSGRRAAPPPAPQGALDRARQPRVLLARTATTALGGRGRLPLVALRIDRIVWDAWNIEHIARHQVTPGEVEEVLRTRPLVAWRVGERRYAIYGQTASGRPLAVFVDQEAPSSVYPVTARRMNDNERRAYRRKP